MKYRKRPVVVDAEQWTFAESIPPAPHFVLRKQVTFWFGYKYWELQTLEGWVRLRVGDWIIRGTHGEWYPCKPDIFAVVYEAAP